MASRRRRRGAARIGLREPRQIWVPRAPACLGTAGPGNLGSASPGKFGLREPRHFGHRVPRHIWARGAPAFWTRSHATASEGGARALCAPPSRWRSEGCQKIRNKIVQCTALHLLCLVGIPEACGLPGSVGPMARVRDPTHAVVSRRHGRVPYPWPLAQAARDAIFSAPALPPPPNNGGGRALLVFFF